MAVFAAVLVAAPVAVVAKVGGIPIVPKGRAEGAEGAVMAVGGTVGKAEGRAVIGAEEGAVAVVAVGLGG